MAYLGEKVYCTNRAMIQNAKIDSQLAAMHKALKFISLYKKRKKKNLNKLISVHQHIIKKIATIFLILVLKLKQKHLRLKCINQCINSTETKVSKQGFTAQQIKCDKTSRENKAMNIKTYHNCTILYYLVFHRIIGILATKSLLMQFH